MRLAAAALDSPVYRYVVTHTPSGPVSATGDLLPFASRFSFHCLDAVAFFGGLGAVLGKQLSEADERFQRLLRRHLVTFAATGELTWTSAREAGLTEAPPPPASRQARWRASGRSTPGPRRCCPTG